MTIHTIDVDEKTAATMLKAAKKAKVPVLSFEAFVLKDWAEWYEKHLVLQAQEATNVR